MPSPKTSKSAELSPRVLLVEGKDDFHVICKLLELYQDVIPHRHIHVVQPLRDEGGVEQIIPRISLEMKRHEVTRLGIVIDSDTPDKKHHYWDRIQRQIAQLSDDPLPQEISAVGAVVGLRLKDGQRKSDEQIRFGVWMMPDNLAPGMLEDFLTRLIPNDDKLLNPIDDLLSSLCAARPRIGTLFDDVHRPKARIHSWLAVQKEPGKTLGQAVAAYLEHRAPLASDFVDWARRLFVD